MALGWHRPQPAGRARPGPRTGTPPQPAPAGGPRPRPHPANPEIPTDSGRGPDRSARTATPHHPAPTVNRMVFLVDYPLTEISTENEAEKQNAILHLFSWI